MSRTVLITGCSSGIGFSIAKKLLEESHTVIGLARRDPSPLLNSECFHFERCDLKELRVASVIFKRLTKQYPEIDVVICNAGLGSSLHLDELSESEVLEMLQVNFTSHVLLVKTFLPLLKQRPSNIIFMGSKPGPQGSKQGSLYSATKFALKGFAKSIQEECSSSLVEVDIFHPERRRQYIQSEEFDDIAKSVVEGLSFKNRSSKNVVSATLLDH